MVNPDFNRLLRVRSLTVGDVARQIFSNTKAVVLVLGGTRPGNPTWRKLAAVLTKDEYDCARNFADQRRKAAARATLGHETDFVTKTTVLGVCAEKEAEQATAGENAFQWCQPKGAA